MTRIDSKKNDPVAPRDMIPGLVYRSLQNHEMTYTIKRGVLTCIETGRTFPEFNSQIFEIVHMEERK